ncbi:hypothetical protein DENSPDRAFT_887064 [Dentipellis sp. KUC8613]|nr:hypothetical protein DENSPDRAFT_887064 [Dentipellis sp. KUC8613]
MHLRRGQPFHHHFPPQGHRDLPFPPPGAPSLAAFLADVESSLTHPPSSASPSAVSQTVTPSGVAAPVEFQEGQHSFHTRVPPSTSLETRRDDNYKGLTYIAEDIGFVGVSMVTFYSLLKNHLVSLRRIRADIYEPPLSSNTITALDSIIARVDVAVTALRDSTIPLPVIHNDIFGAAVDL